MPTEIREEDVETLRLPRNWHSYVRSAVLNVVGIVRIAMLAGRESLIGNGDTKDARIHQLESEVAMLREELRINGARMQRVPSQRRPQYSGIERMAILQLRAVRGWNKTETARHFSLSDDTVRAWLRRADDDALVQTQTPVNRFPDFVRYAVQQIKLYCPTLGKVKIADMLTRAGIHIGKTTVGRILKENSITPPDPTNDDANKQCRIVSKYPGHTWNADLTAVPISGGFWTYRMPNAISQRWPVCWWVLNVVDHFSRRAVGFAVFKCRPASEEVTAALDRIMDAEQVRPKHLIVDQGSEFKCEHFENVWCEAKNILPRFGAVTTMTDKYDTVARLERLPPAARLRSIVKLAPRSVWSRLHPTILGWPDTLFISTACWSRMGRWETTRLLRDRCLDDRRQREIAIRLGAVYQWQLCHRPHPALLSCLECG